MYGNEWLWYDFSDDLPDGVEYQVVGDIAKLKEQEKEKQSESNGSKEKGDANGSIVIGNIIFYWSWIVKYISLLNIIVFT